VTGAAAGGAYEAVLFDALGTLVELEPPWPLLRTAVASAHGIELDEQQAKQAVLAEMSYYKAHHMEGHDEASLAELRARCAAVLQENLPPLAALSLQDVTEALMRSLRFRPYPDAAAALGRLRQLGVRTAVVSNWDVSLKGILAELGLGGLVNGVVVSATAGAAKPHPGIFERALSELRCSARQALFVGDSPETDVAGALAAGMRAVWIDRTGATAEVDAERIFTLESIPELLAPPASPRA
jgi:putative hydrolase of the HAD superfamily